MLAGDLESNSELLKTTLNSIDQGLVMFDSSDTVKICNRRALEILNLSPESMPTRAAFNSFHQHQRQEDGVTELHQHIGRQVSRSCSPMRNRELRSRGPSTAGLSRCVGPRSRRAAKYSPTPTLPPERLRSTRRTTSLPQYSHEIRTPLTGLLGMTDLLAADDLSEKHTNTYKISKIRADIFSQL